MIILVAGISFMFGSLPVYGDGAGGYFLYRQIVEKNYSFSITDPPLNYSGSYIFTRGAHGWSTFYQVGAPAVWFLFSPFTAFLPTPSPARSVLLGSAPILLHDGIAILVISSLCCIGTLLLWTRTLRHIFHFSRIHAVAASFASFIGLPAWYYAFSVPSYAHTIELFFLTLALSLFFRALSQPSLVMFSAIGCAVGVAALTRMDALLYLAIFTIISLTVLHRTAVVPLVILTTSCMIILSLQFIVWHRIFGSIFPNVGYNPQGFTFPLHAADVLFSGSRGFFIWSPIAVIGLVGLCILIFQRHMLSYIAALMGVQALLFYVLFYGSWEMWWGGLSFGQRFLIPLFPFVALGVAAVVRALTSSPGYMRFVGTALVVAAVGYSFSLALLYPTAAQRNRLPLEEDSAPAETARNMIGYYFTSRDGVPAGGWRVWYNATLRPSHLLFSF
ncbi:MAG: hypothetical protein AB1352_03965 [Patescibacteria group bacterium]